MTIRDILLSPLVAGAILLALVLGIYQSRLIFYNESPLWRMTLLHPYHRQNYA